jgi:putative Holliday junction resolvase
MRYLGIDYGEKRVGLAISDDDGKIAFPYKILLNNLELNDVIHNICGQEGISAIVLGESYNSNGEKNKIMGSIEEFKKNMEGELELPVFLEKEFMTTVHARDLLRQASGYNNKVASSATRRRGGKKQGRADANAATLILQRFLDRKNNK